MSKNKMADFGGILIKLIVSNFDKINQIMNDNGSELDDYLDRDDGKCLY